MNAQPLGNADYPGRAVSRLDPESEYRYLRMFQRFQRHKLEVYFLCSFWEKVIKKNIMEAYISSVINKNPKGG